MHSTLKNCADHYTSFRAGKWIETTNQSWMMGIPHVKYKSNLYILKAINKWPFLL